MHHTKMSWWERRTTVERRLVKAVFGLVAVCFVLIITLAFLSGAAYRSLQIHTSTEICFSPGCIRTASHLLKDMDLTVEPCDDFYKYTCGNFIKNTPIPDDKAAVSTSSPTIDRLKEQMRTVIEAPVQSGDPKAIQLAKRLYSACINRTLVEKRKFKPMFNIIKRLGGWPVLAVDEWKYENFSWRQMYYHLRSEGFFAGYILDFDIITDWKNSTRRVMKLDQPSFGLERVHIIKGMEDKLVREYHKYQVDLAVTFGADKWRAEDEMRDALDFEIKLANISLSPEERRNFSHLYHPMTVLELQQHFPFMPWRDHFRSFLPSSINFNEEDVVIVYVPHYISQLEHILSTTPKKYRHISARGVVANYMMWRAVSSMAKYLHGEVRNLQLRYYAALYGVKERESRWKECVSVTFDEMEIAVGSLYVRKYFDDYARREARKIVGSIRQEMVKIIRSIDWMDDTTRKIALRKIHSVEEHIGYPDEILDNNKLDEYYDGLVVNSSLYAESILNVTKFKIKLSYDRFRQPINKSEWINHALIPIVNAFYNDHENSIDIPAGILQGIFFSKGGPRYINYGAIGSVIGHEITHGFDDQGRQYDDKGNLVDWWAKETQQRYLDKARCIIEQYGNYTAKEVDLKLNGVNTQGENIADNGGLKQAYRAYTAWDKRYGPEPALPGLNLSPKQLFWVSAAYSWCAKYRPETLRSWMPVGEHPPAEFRVLGPFSNQKDFAKDFNCPLGSNMNPVHKCQVW